MSMEKYLRDLEAQFDHLYAEGERATVDDLKRTEVSQQILQDRLFGSIGHTVEVHLGSSDFGAAHGVLTECAEGWILLKNAGEEKLIPVPSITAIDGLSQRIRHSEGPPSAMTRSLQSVLRRWARDRREVRLSVAGQIYYGRILAVAADHLDLGLFASPGQRSEKMVRTVALSALQLISRQAS